MPKINVYLPDELAEAVRAYGVPVSAVCQRALEQAVRRVTAIRETALGELDDADLLARLPHFTPRARTAVRLGIERSRADGSAGVGTAHLLDGILAEGGNLALHVLRVEEIETERLAGDLAGQPAAEPGVAADSPSQHFSGPAANALELAVTEATTFGHNYVGCEHLLLGLIAEPDGVAGQLLRSRGAELRLTRRAVAAALAGYVHLRAQAQAQPPAGAAGTPTELASMLAAAVAREVQPIVARIERLEERAGVTGED
ncbi:Clp protease N-terminal domain-containing protein [Plantactinospora soyae]|uniref:ATP-dependent Clp protease ATP-binding subunit ClpC n=1 Tax=Plantactinospora soyae TaxID=1544732 RepID=A0A927M2W8_9ACTN|nr:Clp protease N-terminal domain-containing protein [Plantactinospora soyae]MBE1484568.1 ATP-dependent Clp protease ATP-binding subunit ClpC [Plantactinospora soyae]